MNLEYWKQFESSGKIEDYLSFVSNERTVADIERDMSKEAGDAGIYYGDGNHIKAVSRGGVRQTYQPSD